MKPTNISLLVDKHKITETMIQDSPVPVVNDGEVLFHIEKYAFTTNNITYAVTGHKLGYWDFFPAKEPWGTVPVWGFAKVVQSKDPDVMVGTRYYGYWPMGEYLKVVPGQKNPFGFSDVSVHRQALAPIYNYYSAIDTDQSYATDIEDYIPIIRPLFTTSFLNYYYIKDLDFSGADQVVLTSASSKTALGVAYMLQQNKSIDGKTIVGLTSKRNVAFVEKTGFYDEVVSYDDMNNEVQKRSTIVVDLAGSGLILNQLEDILDDRLKFISLIGLTDYKAGIASKNKEKTQFFFAPTQAQKVYKEWGVSKANMEISKALKAFINIAQEWISLSYIESYEDLGMLYHEMLAGHVNPSMGYVVTIKDESA